MGEFVNNALNVIFVTLILVILIYISDKSILSMYQIIILIMLVQILFNRRK
jgi:hypothetical protein